MPGVPGLSVVEYWAHTWPRVLAPDFQLVRDPHDPRTKVPYRMSNVTANVVSRISISSESRQ